MGSPLSRRLTAALASAALITLSAAQPATAQSGGSTATHVPKLVPVPVSLHVTSGTYQITAKTKIVVPSGAGLRAASYLAGLLRRSTGFPLPIAREGSGIVLDASGGVGQGDEGYRLTVTSDGVLINADTGEGLFRGVQTLRQLLPA